MSEKGESFLCGRCRKLMCNDCRDIADEYAELLQARTRALVATNTENENLKQENARLKREKAEWERMAKLGYAEIITQWIDEQVKKGMQR